MHRMTLQSGNASRRVDASVVPNLTRRTVSLPFSRGGLGIQSASRTQPAAFWASWADGLEMVQQRHPEVAHLIISEMHHGSRSESIRGSAERSSVKLGLTCQLGKRSLKVLTQRTQTSKMTVLLHELVGSGQPPPDSRGSVRQKCGSIRPSEH